MGVHDLWSIVEPVRESVPLYSLSGKTLAVDLSLWVCEAQHVQAMMGRVTKPHLRNLFFRVSSLTLMGVKLVFVMEGEAPKLKAETMNKRTETRYGGFKKASGSKSSSNTGRGRFKAVLREVGPPLSSYSQNKLMLSTLAPLLHIFCPSPTHLLPLSCPSPAPVLPSSCSSPAPILQCAEMLDYLGVPWVTAAGEAEAMCAYLDSQGLVDGCITNDGDAFLYGARTIYRNFNMNSKDPQVDCYRTSRVQTELNLSRENLVGLAVLLGCVGKEQALRLIQLLKGQTLLQRFIQWKGEDAGTSKEVVKKVAHCHVCRHPEHYVFPEDHPAEDHHEVRTVEEEALFRVAYPEVVESYLRDKALAEENKTKKKKQKSKKEKPCDASDGISVLLAQMTLQSSSNTQPQMLLPSISNLEEPEVVILDTPVNHKKSKDDHSSVGDCPSTPLPCAQSEATASPNVSAVINALHLSDIDWDALSFTSSPTQQSATNHTTEPKPSKTTDGELKGENVKQRSSSDVIETNSKSAVELCYTECPLRERVLMRNAAKATDHIQIANDVVSKQLNYELASLKHVSPYDSKPTGQIPNKGCSDSKLLTKPAVNKKEPLADKQQCATNTAEPETHSSKQQLRPAVEAQRKTMDKRNGSQKPPQRFKFVRTAISSSTVPTQRCHSDPGQTDKDKNMLQTTKKSVCTSVCSSGEESDAENQQKLPVICPSCPPFCVDVWECLDISNMELEVVRAKILSDWSSHEGAFGEDQDPLQSASPESSIDSMCSSPEMCFSGGHREAKDFSLGFSGRGATPAAQRLSKPKMSTKRRMKASEREKMRMRSLAEALHQLRDYLPPDYSKRGQPLTKIQTLKYTIEYINKLSDILSRAGRGFKGRGRGGRMSRGGGMRGGRGMMKGFGPPGHGRGRPKDGGMNGFAPMRGMRRMRPYPDLRGHRGRGGPMGMGPPPPPPPPPMHLRGPFPPMPRHGPPPPPPPGHPAFRGRPPHPRGRGMPPPGPPRHFHPRGPRGYHNGPVSPPPHPPPGRGQRWPGPPGGRRF
ncbi:hypothetical protein L3Q82_001333 [Scortum barcoo]|uniref:Uncharacterized protein n=1 Tax=Scortum barcoo TaxID=214431 RepID=A0ACB8W6S7_9TELE|nr:hypothetical protein L3Q82_001333 [Scortum barcoo]